ncbi:9732_t:CDS:2, partial [Dentiscutata erythropus]
ITQSTHNLRILHYIRRGIGCGKIYSHANGSKLRIINNKHLKDLVLSIFNQYPLLTSKYYDYIKFKKALEMLNDSQLKKSKISEVLKNGMSDVDTIPSAWNAITYPFKSADNVKLVMSRPWLVGFVEAKASFFLKVVFCPEATKVLYHEKENIYEITTTNLRAINNISHFLNYTFKGMKSLEFRIWARSMNYKSNLNKISKAAYCLIENELCESFLSTLDTLSPLIEYIDVSILGGGVLILSKSSDIFNELDAKYYGYKAKRDDNNSSNVHNQTLHQRQDTKFANQSNCQHSFSTTKGDYEQNGRGVKKETDSSIVEEEANKIKSDETVAENDEYKVREKALMDYRKPLKINNIDDDDETWYTCNNVIPKEWLGSNDYKEPAKIELEVMKSLIKENEPNNNQEVGKEASNYYQESTASKNSRRMLQVGYGIEINEHYLAKDEDNRIMESLMSDKKMPSRNNDDKAPVSENKLRSLPDKLDIFDMPKVEQKGRLKNSELSHRGILNIWSGELEGRGYQELAKIDKTVLDQAKENL